jgi:hypothetical protein
MSVTVRPVTPAGMRAVTFELTDFEGDSGGVGGWESLARPRRRPAAGWVGTPERTYVLPVILDGIDAIAPDVDRVVDEDLAAVQAWAIQHRTTGEPPILQLLGTRRVASTDRWVLQEIEWGQYLTNDRDQVIQQELTLTFLQYFAPTLVKGPARKIRSSKPPKPKPKPGKGGRKKKRKRA